MIISTLISPICYVRRYRTILSLVVISTIFYFPFTHLGAQTTVCYAVSEDNADNQLFKYDPVSEIWTHIGSTLTDNIETIAYDPINDILYTANLDSIGFIDTLTGQFTVKTTIDIVHGASGDLDVQDIDGMSYDPRNNILFASERIGGAGNEDFVFAISMDSCRVVRDFFGSGQDYRIIEQVFDSITMAMNADVDDIALEHSTGRLYMNQNAGGAGGMLTYYDFDLDSVFIVAAIGVGDIEGLGFDASGVLLASTGSVGANSDEFFIIDPSNGDTTRLGDIDTTGTFVDFESIDCFTIFHDLALNKKLSDGISVTLSDGDTVCYDITVFNQGEYTSYNTEVVDYIPSSLSLISSGYTVVDDKAYTTITTPIPPGDSATLNICFEIASRFSGRIDNYAEIRSSENQQGDSLADIDSHPDDSNTEAPVLDNDINSSSGDEDDHDIESVVVAFSGLCDGNAELVFAEFEVTNPENALGAPDGLSAGLQEDTDFLTLYYGAELDSGSTVSVVWRRSPTTGDNPIIQVEFSSDGSTWTQASGSPFAISSLAYITQSIETTSSSKFIRFSSTNVFDVDIDAIEYSNQSCDLVAGPLDLPWATEECDGQSSILHPGVASITCGATTSTPVDERFSFAMISLNDALPPPDSGKIEVTNTDSVYHHPTWHIDSIGNVFGVTLNTTSSEVFITASSNYGSAFWMQESIIRYGSIGGGVDDLGAAGTVYRIDPMTGEATVFAQLPQQQSTIVHRDCEDDGFGTPRMTGVGLGNITYDSLHNQYFVTNIEDGRIYRISSCGDILDSFDPFTYDDGGAGISILEELPYGIAVEPGSDRLFFGIIDSTAGVNTAGVGAVGVYSIDLNASGGFEGSIDNTFLPGGATYDNYVSGGTNDPVLHIDIATGSGQTFTEETTYIVSDLSFSPNGDLLAGIRVSCHSTFFSSYNHWGETNILALNNGTNLYDSAIELDLSFGGPGDDDSYGGVGHYELADGSLHYVASYSDIIEELGPHGIAIWNADSTNSPVEPVGAFSYGLVNNDPKGAGGDIDVYSECIISCAISSNSPVCATTDLQLNGMAVLDSVVWTGPNSFFSNDQNPIISNATSSNAGVYTYTIYDSNGCVRSSCFLTVTVLPTSTGMETYTGCEGDGFNVTVGTSTYDESNPMGVDTLVAGNGCDSIITTTLTFLPNFTGTETYTGCEGDGFSVTVGTSTYDEFNPMGVDTLVAGNGCDSIVITTLTFLPNLTGTETYTGCEGDGFSVTVGASIYDESNPMGVDTLVAGNGCDSIVTTTLTFLPNLTGTETHTGCEGDGFSVIVGTSTYDESNPMGVDTLSLIHISEPTRPY